MQFTPKEPDIETLCKRIEKGIIDLQPDFQRGEVWPTGKKQRLIDTILRNWIVPPILLITTPSSSTVQVLDGQQRLAAIRDFRNGVFPIDGHIEPLNEVLAGLHGQRYSQLPKVIADKFDQTALRIYEITDYKPSEPAEIFFRLNQPTALTSAEKRNAFYGPVRDQIRDLAEALKITPDFMPAAGFGNSRMAYDDVLARVAFTLENCTLRKKVTEASINAMYRRNEPLSDITQAWLSRSVRMTASAIVTSYRNRSSGKSLKFNKATLFSWLIFFARLSSQSTTARGASFLDHFEAVRQGHQVKHSLTLGGLVESNSTLISLLSIYSDRSTSRVADTSSVLLRDFVLWLNWLAYAEAPELSNPEEAWQLLNDFDSFITTWEATNDAGLDSRRPARPPSSPHLLQQRRRRRRPGSTNSSSSCRQVEYRWARSGTG